MYPKNAASPPQIAIGPVVQISDGAVQTSGCTVRIIPIGVAEGDGAGTTAYSTDGIVLYTPTQAETNYSSFILIAKKTGCIPASVTVVTTDSSTAGQVNVKTLPTIPTDWIAADGVKADAVTKIQNGLATPTNITSASGVALTAAYDAAKTAATQASVDTIDGIVDSILADTGTDGVVVAAGSKTGYAIGNGGIAAAAFAAGALDAAALNADAGTEIANAIKAAVIEAQGNYTIQQALSIILAVLAGVTTDNGATLKTPNGAASRVSATIDANANRTAMTLTPSA